MLSHMARVPSISVTVRRRTAASSEDSSPEESTSNSDSDMAQCNEPWRSRFINRLFVCCGCGDGHDMFSGPRRPSFIRRVSRRLCELGFRRFCRPVLRRLRRPSFNDINRLCDRRSGCHGPVLCSPKRPSVIELCEFGFCRRPVLCELRRPSFNDANRLWYCCGGCDGPVRGNPGGPAPSASKLCEFGFVAWHQLHPSLRVRILSWPCTLQPQEAHQHASEIGTTSADDRTGAKPVGEARPPEIAKYTATTKSELAEMDEARPPGIAKYTATTKSELAEMDEARPPGIAKYGVATEPELAEFADGARPPGIAKHFSGPRMPSLTRRLNEVGFCGRGSTSVGGWGTPARASIASPSTHFSQNGQFEQDDIPSWLKPPPRRMTT